MNCAEKMYKYLSHPPRIVCRQSLTAVSKERFIALYAYNEKLKEKTICKYLEVNTPLLKYLNNIQHTENRGPQKS